jgi:hypothetical protein
MTTSGTMTAWPEERDLVGTEHRTRRVGQGFRELGHTSATNRLKLVRA